MKAIKVFAVEIELYDDSKWIAWSTENVIADDITSAVAKAVRAYKRYGANRVRASSAKFVLAAR